jgi:hypothetical protein
MVDTPKKLMIQKTQRFDRLSVRKRKSPRATTMRWRKRPRLKR